MAQSIVALLQKEMEQEAKATRRMLERVPDDKFDWKPHEKSMSIRQLATHIAELPSWVTMALTTNELDFAAAPYEPTQISNRAELLDLFDKSLEDGRTSLGQATDDALWGSWQLRNGDQVLADMTKYETIRHAFAQTSHHRAQLGMDLRLLNVPIPGTYGPSADEPGF